MALVDCWHCGGSGRLKPPNEGDPEPICSTCGGAGKAER